MLRLTILLPLLAGATPLMAEPRHVVGNKDGIEFDYTADLRADQSLLLRGAYLDNNEEFRLTVSPRGHVEGWVGSTPVSYDVAPATRNAAVEEFKQASGTELADLRPR